MPTPDVYASCPRNGNVLDYYAGIFDAVFVSLSPFIEPISISPDLFFPETYPDRRTIVNTCEAVPWREIMSLTELPSLSAIDIGLRTLIHGLHKKYENLEFSNRIVTMIDSTGIIPPTEGEHSDLLHNCVLELFQELGHQWVWVGDEFCSERKLHWIEDLKSEQEPTIVGHCNVFSPDKSLLWTVHWDSHFSFLCSSSDKLKSIGIAERLEGFFCIPSTDVYWSLHEG